MQSRSFLDALEAQATAIRASHSGITVAFTRGPDDREKISAWLEVTGDQALGQVTVWSSGECEIEADDSDGSILLRRTLFLQSPDDLESAVRELARLLASGYERVV